MAGCEMKKGEELIWELFEMVRELMPPTAVNAERFQRWSERFHEMEGAEPAPAAVEETEADDEDMHEHGAPSPRVKAKRK